MSLRAAIRWCGHIGLLLERYSEHMQTQEMLDRFKFPYLVLELEDIVATEIAAFATGEIIKGMHFV